LLVCYLNKQQNAWCNDKDNHLLLMLFLPNEMQTQPYEYIPHRFRCHVTRNSLRKLEPGVGKEKS